MFKYFSFAKEFSKLNIDNIRITLCGHNSKIHDMWTRVPDSFNETINGIKNLVYLKQPIQVNILVWKKNFKHIKEIMETVLPLGIKNLDLFNVAPLGRARRVYRQIVVDLPQLRQINRELINYIDLFKNIDVEDFPQCIFEPIFFEKKNVHIFDTSGCVYLDKKGQVANFSVFSAQEKKLPISSKLYSNPKLLTSALTGFKVKMPVCSNCSYSQSCSGIFNEYLKLKGEEKVKKELLILRKWQSRLY
jgi:MoaA/NifB/PqqE/SkfB family radical SAM enzyme